MRSPVLGQSQLIRESRTRGWDGGLWKMSSTVQHSENSQACVLCRQPSIADPSPFIQSSVLQSATHSPRFRGLRSKSTSLVLQFVQLQRATLTFRLSLPEHRLTHEANWLVCLLVAIALTPFTRAAENGEEM